MGFLPAKTVMLIFHPTVQLDPLETDKVMLRAITEIYPAHLKKLVRIMQRSKYPVYVGHEESKPPKWLVDALPNAVFFKTEQRSPLPLSLNTQKPRKMRIKEWDGFAKHLREQGFERILLGGTTLEYAEPNPGVRGDNLLWCLGGAFRELKKRRFDVQLLPAACWPQKGHSTPELRGEPIYSSRGFILPKSQRRNRS